MDIVLKKEDIALAFRGDPEQPPDPCDLKQLAYGLYRNAKKVLYQSPTGRMWLIKERTSTGPIPRLLQTLTSSEIPTGTKCEHFWRHYDGFAESYDYCEYCDKKKYL